MKPNSYLTSSRTFTLVKSIFILIFLFFCACGSPSDEESSQYEAGKAKDSKLSQAENDLQLAVQHFLFVAGNYDLEGVRETLVDKANIGRLGYDNGTWSASSMSFDEYFENVNNGIKSPFIELVNNYEFLQSDGQLANVKAEATLHRYGYPLSINIDHFTFLNVDGHWKILNVSYTRKEISNEDRQFDLEIFAKGYAQAWCSQRPEFVASFFEEGGSMVVNDVEPAVGRAEIQEVANSFMMDLPDMIVRFDSLVNDESGTEFHWTLIGTHEPSGSMVDVKGHEEWEIGENNLILRSIGHFPDDDYSRQIESGKQDQ